MCFFFCKTRAKPFLEHRHGFQPPRQRLTWRAKRGRHSSKWCPAAVCLVKMNPINLKDLADRWYVVLMKFQYISICFNMCWYVLIISHNTSYKSRVKPSWQRIKMTADARPELPPMVDLWIYTTSGHYRPKFWQDSLINTDQPWYQALSTNPILSKNHPSPLHQHHFK